jgi:hypothetical protein
MTPAGLQQRLHDSLDPMYASLYIHIGMLANIHPLILKLCMDNFAAHITQRADTVQVYFAMNESNQPNNNNSNNPSSKIVIDGFDLDSLLMTLLHFDKLSHAMLQIMEVIHTTTEAGGTEYTLKSLRRYCSKRPDHVNLLRYAVVLLFNPDTNRFSLLLPLDSTDVIDHSVIMSWARRPYRESIDTMKEIKHNYCTHFYQKLDQLTWPMGIIVIEPNKAKLRKRTWINFTAETQRAAYHGHEATSMQSIPFRHISIKSRNKLQEAQLSFDSFQTGSRTLQYEGYRVKNEVFFTYYDLQQPVHTPINLWSRLTELNNAMCASLLMCLGVYLVIHPLLLQLHMEYYNQFRPEITYRVVNSETGTLEEVEHHWLIDNRTFDDYMVRLLSSELLWDVEIVVVQCGITKHNVAFNMSIKHYRSRADSREINTKIVLLYNLNTRMFSLLLPDDVYMQSADNVSKWADEWCSWFRESFPRHRDRYIFVETGLQEPLPTVDVIASAHQPDEASMPSEHAGPLPSSAQPPSSHDAPMISEKEYKRKLKKWRTKANRFAAYCLVTYCPWDRTTGVPPYELSWEGLQQWIERQLLPSKSIVDKTRLDWLRNLSNGMKVNKKAMKMTSQWRNRITDRWATMSRAAVEESKQRLDESAEREDMEEIDESGYALLNAQRFLDQLAVMYGGIPDPSVNDGTSLSPSMKQLAFNTKAEEWLKSIFASDTTTNLSAAKGSKRDTMPLPVLDKDKDALEAVSKAIAAYNKRIRDQEEVADDDNDADDLPEDEQEEDDDDDQSIGLASLDSYHSHVSNDEQGQAADDRDYDDDTPAANAPTTNTYVRLPIDPRIRTISNRLPEFITQRDPTREDCVQTPPLSEEQVEALLECLRWLRSDYLRISSSRSVTHEEFKRHHLKLSVLGGPGAGKSTFINALCRLVGVAGRGRDGLVTVVTPTGVAATVYEEATTIHSLFRWKGGGKRNNIRAIMNAPPKQRAHVRNNMNICRILACDEVSMLSQEMHRDMNAALQSIFEKSLPYGGLGIVLLGDFCQLPPVGGRPLFAEYNKPLEIPDLYKEFEIIEFNDQQRTRADQAHSNAIKQLRDVEHFLNPIDDEMLNHIQVLRKEDCIDIDNSFRYAPIATTSNMACALYNKIRAIQYAQDHNKPIIRFRFNLCSKESKKIFKTGDGADNMLYNTFDELSFYFVQDAPARCHVNMCISLGIANGSQCTLHSLVLSETDKQRLQKEQPKPGEIFDLQQPPLAVNVKFTTHKTISANMTLVEKELVIPMYQSKKEQTITLNKMKLKYYPWNCSLLFASTYHKLQSLTMDRVIMDLNPSPQCALVLYHFIVGISRVRKFADVRMLQLFDGDRQHLLKLKHSPAYVRWWEKWKGKKAAKEKGYAKDPRRKTTGGGRRGGRGQGRGRAGRKTFDTTTSGSAGRSNLPPQQQHTDISASAPGKPIRVDTSSKPLPDELPRQTAATSAIPPLNPTVSQTHPLVASSSTAMTTMPPPPAKSSIQKVTSHSEEIVLDQTQYDILKLRAPTLQQPCARCYHDVQPISISLDCDGIDVIPCIQHNFGQYMNTLASSIPSSLHTTSQFRRDNSCWVIHLGIAIGVHPFILLLAYQYHARRLLIQDENNEINLKNSERSDLNNVLQHNGLINAEIVQPIKLDALQYTSILVLTEYGPDDAIDKSLSKATLTVFEPCPEHLIKRYVVIRCIAGVHFTILSPLEGNTPAQIEKWAKQLKQTFAYAKYKTQDKDYKELVYVSPEMPPDATVYPIQSIVIETMQHTAVIAHYPSTSSSSSSSSSSYQPAAAAAAAAAAITTTSDIGQMSTDNINIATDRVTKHTAISSSRQQPRQPPATGAAATTVGTSSRSEVALVAQAANTTFHRTQGKLPVYRLDQLNEPIQQAVQQFIDQYIYSTRPSANIGDEGHNVEITSIDAIVILLQDMKRFRPNEWLHDEIMNSFINIQQREHLQYLSSQSSTPTTRVLMFMTTYFYAKLTQNNRYNYEGVRRWTLQRFFRSNFPSSMNITTIFDVSEIFIPINISNTHWVLIVINMREKVIHYYDSIEHDKSVQPLAYFEHLKRWIEDEARTKLNNDSYRADDFVWNDHNEAPFQTNPYDCGVFVLMAIHYIVNDLPFDYNTDEGRQYIATVCRSKIAVMIFRESINMHNERYMPIVLDDD